MAAAAGIPPTILTAYRAYIENLLLYKCLAGGIGRPHTRKCGVPQGCPFSMMMVALIMRPWVLLMRLIGWMQRFTLAGDVFILSTGKRMIGKFARGLNETRNGLQAMGAKAAPSESYNFASNKKLRCGCIEPGRAYQSRYRTCKGLQISWSSPPYR